MSSAQGFYGGSLDFRHMYSIHDRRGKLPEAVTLPNTILDYISKNPQTQMFMKIIEKTNLLGKLNNVQGDFTLFVPIDGGIPEELFNCADYTAQKLVLLHSLEHSVHPDFLKSSKCMTLNTRQLGESILVENKQGRVVINQQSRVISATKVGRAIVYLIDRMILPSSNPMSF